MLGDRIGECLRVGGRRVVSNRYGRFIPKADDLELAVQAKGGKAKITALQVHELRSAWNTH